MVKIDKSKVRKRKVKKTTPVKKKMVKKNVQVQVEEKLQVQVKKTVKKKPKKLTPTQKKWFALAPESKTEGKSNWYTVEQIISSGLSWTNNGNQRKGKFFRLTSYIWEKEEGKRGKVIKVRTVGFDPEIQRAEMWKNRPIADEILKYCHSQCCVACGSNKAMVADHKNDLYNDPRVHNKSTQLLSDFQPLCNGCNLKKRAACIKTEKEGKRQPAPFQLTSCGLPPFIKGDEKFDPDSIQGMVGTYWYDVAEYQQKARMMILNIN